MKNGTGISSYIHVVGDLSCDTLHITEGAMKADIASFLSGGRTLYRAYRRTEPGIWRTLRQLKPKRILECVDMDCRTNPHVQRAQAKSARSVPAVRGIPTVYLAGGTEGHRRLFAV